MKRPEGERPCPTSSPCRPALQLTAIDPVFRERPHDYLDRLRTEEPVHRDTEIRRLFLTRFEDVKAVMSNRSLSVDPRKAPGTWYYSSVGRTHGRNSSIHFRRPSSRRS